MRIIFFVIGVLLFCLSIVGVSNARPTDVKSPLKIGAKVPDINFINVVNSDRKQVKLSDFKGKAIILDFWATWCGTCVGKIPALNKYQKEFGSDLQIFLIANDDESKVRTFYDRRPGLVLPSEIISSISAGSYLQSLFPHLVIPHYIWIDREGYLVAVTGAEDVTEENIKSFIAGNLKRLEIKTDSIQLNSKSGMVIDSIHGTRAKRISINPLIKVQSMVTQFDWRVTPGLGRSNQTDNIRFVDLCNMPISALYWYAFFGLDNYNRLSGMLIETKDSISISSPGSELRKNESQYNLWQRSNFYSYRLITPKSLDSSAFMERMQNEIVSAFGYQAKFEYREEPCYVLRLNSRSEHLLSNGKVPNIDASSSYMQLENMPISALVDAISNHTGLLVSSSLRRPRLNIYDETGLKQNIDITLQGDLRNEEVLKTVLYKEGIDLVKIVKRQKFLVVKDK
ncbi:redoxin family protein [Filimonas effusa]|uniref:Redoxin domain-containing protein n=1 Tax=Filimonas effusa TaxID=2508721 RepID=A0A4Q1D2R2_9BACT|nr:redoxin family protein [Filimonas effusa]RXK81682.1 redoxin domain-containing protein [Filimonas effusa]